MSETANGEISFRIDYSSTALAVGIDDFLPAQLIVDHADDFLSIENGRDEYVYASPGIESLFGWRQGDLLGFPVRSLIHAEDQYQVTEERSKLRAPDIPQVRYRYRLRCRSGLYRWAESRSRRDRNRPYVVTVTRDFDDQMRQLMELEHLASYDALTNLLNRRAIETALHAELSRSQRQAQPLSVALFDIDGFKRINDTRGHLAGDQLLRSLSACIERSRRLYDFIGRWGGDEFLLSMPNTTTDQAADILSRMREIVAHELPGITLSLGISSNAAADSLHDLLAQADAALYRSKRRGGDQVVTWQPDIQFEASKQTMHPRSCSPTPTAFTARTTL